MLVLTRRNGEKIIIGEKLITLTVIEVKEDYVRLGIDAPKNISIHREEIYDRIKDKKEKGNK